MPLRSITFPGSTAPFSSYKGGAHHQRQWLKQMGKEPQFHFPNGLMNCSGKVSSPSATETINMSLYPVKTDPD